MQATRTNTLNPDFRMGLTISLESEPVETRTDLELEKPTGNAPAGKNSAFDLGRISLAEI